MNAPNKSKILKACGISAATVGLATVAVLGYQVANDAWLSNAPAIATQNKLVADMKAELGPSTPVDTGAIKAAKENPATPKKEPVKEVPVATADKLALLTNDALGEKPIIEGDKSSYEANNALLDTGAIVHYQSTDMPGAVGNFAVSGHRTGHGAVLNGLGELELGDTVSVKTSKATYEYKVIKPATQVRPDQNHMLDSNPLGDKKNTTRSLMTITSCALETSTIREYVVLELSADAR